MPADYTVIFQVRQWFGDHFFRGDNTTISAIATEFDTAPYVGRSGDYPFRCPKVDRSEEAVLHFAVYGADTDHTIQINGRDIPGGIKACPWWDGIKVNGRPLPMWSSQTLIVPAGYLRKNNTLTIATAPPRNQFQRYVDDFIVDNVSLHYKLRPAKDLRGTVAGSGR